jgi:CBS-domain-containing membrane protein
MLALRDQGRSEHEISLAFVVAGAAGGAIAIALMELMSEHAAFPLLLIPFATSIVLVMGSPEIEAAQPRALVGGHLVASLVGLLVVKMVGPGPWAAAVAVGLAMLAMHITRSFHPPAGIDPLVIVVNDMSWSFLLAPVAIGAVLLAALAFVWHRLCRHGLSAGHTWPARWW